MPRRGENIYKRKDGRWEGRYIADRKPDGGALYRSVYGTTYADVRQKLAVYREENRKQQLRGCTLTVKELLAHWQAENSQIKPTSRERYRVLIQQHIEPELGAQRVCDLTEEKLNCFVDRKLKSGRLDGKGGLAPKTVNDICVIVRSALKLARRKFRYNGEEEIRAPAVKQRRIETFSGWECCRISAEILRKPSVENLAYLLCLETGIRLGDDDDKIRLNQRKPSKYKGLSRFGPEKNLQRINKFMKERPIFYKNLIQMKENIRFYLRCFYCITKVVILQFNSENRTELARNG